MAIDYNAVRANIDLKFGTRQESLKNRAREVKTQAPKPMAAAQPKTPSSPALPDSSQSKTGNTARRVKDTLSGAAKSYGSGVVNALGTAYNTRHGNYVKETEREAAGSYSRQAQRFRQEYEDMLAENRAKPGTWNDQLLHTQKQKAEKAAQTYRNLSGLANSDYRQAAANQVYALADQLSRSANRDIARAKDGLGGLGRLAVDVGVGASQLAGDIAVGAGATAALPMALRAFGGKAQEARHQGASLDKQVAAGTASALTGLLTEKLSSVGKIQTKAFGSGALDDILDGVADSVTQMGKSPAGKAVLNRMAGAGTGFLGEGLEEGLDSVADQLLVSRIYSDEPIDWKQLGADAAYSALVGGAIGGLTRGIGGAKTSSTKTSQEGKLEKSRNTGRVTGTLEQFAQGYRAKRNPNATDTQVQEQYQRFKQYAKDFDTVDTTQGPLTRAEIKEKLAGLHDEQEIDRVVDGILDRQEKTGTSKPLSAPNQVRTPGRMPVGTLPEFQAAYLKKYPDTSDTIVQAQYEQFKSFARDFDSVETAAGLVTRREINDLFDRVLEQQGNGVKSPISRGTSDARELHQYERSDAQSNRKRVDGKHSVGNDAPQMLRPNQEYRHLSETAEPRTKDARIYEAEFGDKEVARATAEYKRVENLANSMYDIGSAKENVAAWLRDKPIREQIGSERYPLKLHAGRQNRHVPGTNEYKQYVAKFAKQGQYGPSRLTIDEAAIHALVSKYHGTGILLKSDDGQWRSIERITIHPEEIGVAVNNLTGAEAATTTFTIRYSKDGFHIVPDYPSRKGERAKK